jgi:hypothetical protein
MWYSGSRSESWGTALMRTSATTRGFPLFIVLGILHPQVPAKLTAF